MSKMDTLKTAKRSLSAQERALDKNPHKSTKKAKRKERQMGKKQAQIQLKES